MTLTKAVSGAAGIYRYWAMKAGRQIHQPPHDAIKFNDTGGSIIGERRTARASTVPTGR